MTAMVRVSAGDQPVRILRVEEQGGIVILDPGQHETFTVRPHERIVVEGHEAGVSGHVEHSPPKKEPTLPPSQVG